MAAEFKIGRLRYQWQGAWQSGYAYIKDAVVSYQGKTYVCLLPNTASANFYTDLYATPYPLWQQIIDGKSFVGTWATSTLYNLGNIAVFKGKAYYCTTTHTSTQFVNDVSNWAEYTEFFNWTNAWQPSTVYGLNDIVKYGGVVYQCIVNHTSQTTLESNQAYWNVINSGIEFKGTFSYSYQYKYNDLVKFGADLYICNTGHTSTSTFDPTKWALWMPGYEYQGTFSTSATYQPGDTVSYGGYDYVCITQNYTYNSLANSGTGNAPSVDSTDWTLFTQGYEFKNDWVVTTVYKVGDVVRKHGMLYEAIVDHSGRDPAAFTSTANYTLAGSSGTTLVVSSTSGILSGMIVQGPGFTAGQSVSQVVNGTTLLLGQAPDGTIADATTLTFIGLNYIYWKLLVPGTFWTKTWIVGGQYSVGDIVVWQNGTYVCIQNNTGTYNADPVTSGTLLYGTSGTGTGNRPDIDTTNMYWVFYVPHSRKNAMNTLGDMETYYGGKYVSLPIGNQQYVLRNTGGVPTWTKINIVPQVYYVSNTTGVDSATYGTSWDQPWKTIAYACNTLVNGYNYPNTTTILKTNKQWLIAEMYNWMLYQMQTSTSPFSPSSVWDQSKTIRDAGFIIDALIYDLSRGGNSQLVATTLSYFAFGQTGIFFDSAIVTEIAYFTAAINQLANLITNYAIPQIQPAQSYQTLMSASTIVHQVVTLPGQEVTSLQTGAISGQNASITLLSILQTAITAQSTLNVPASNSGLTATIFVKTGTYPEPLPILVPENVAIVGDELRGVVVEPLVNITTTCTASNNNLLTVTSVAGFADQMPVQFVDPTISTSIVYTALAGLNAGQTYYIIGSTINAVSNQFAVAYSPTTTFTGSVTSGSPTVTEISSFYGLAVGATITGSGIPPNTTITAIGSTTLTMSASATVTKYVGTLVSIGARVPLQVFFGSSMTVYAGDCLKDMFRLTNGTGLRNMTFTGLQGTLGAPDTFQIQRPTGGSYACLAPGLSPNDTSVWIFRRSPYVQNVTAFGNGCAALKIDGSLHNGGNKSIVCNDFTHIVNDGIGIWCTGPGALTEAVSVFSYYGYAGYFADAGGRIRATNGNTSYGTYGVISSGYDTTETPATGVIFNQSSQVQAVVQQSYGSNSQILRLQYTNAGSSYTTSTTNLLNYSNSFTGPTWSSDGNVVFSKVNIAPTGLTEAWTMTGLTSGPDGSYLYQNIAIPQSGGVFTNLSPQNASGNGSGSVFTITVTSTAYLATITNGGTGYTNLSQIYITGGYLGGVNNINDCTLTITGTAGSGTITSVSVSGTVPVGSAFNYTFSVYVKQGTAPSIDLQAIYSGSATRTSSINYNFLSNQVNPSTTNGGFVPLNYGAINVQTSSTAANAGWYRLWFTAYDITGLNTQVQFRIYPRGYTGSISQYTYFYGAQVENSLPSFKPSFYLEVINTSKYTAFANYNISGAGTGVISVGDETRSNSVFNTRIVTDSNGVTGGAGFLTASNSAQTGTGLYVQLAQSDTNLNANYTGMRVFIQSGTGAGQYGYISYYDSTSKNAYVLKESFNVLNITSTSSNSNAFTLGSGNTSSLYQNMPVQFIPTYYTTAITSTSLSQTTVTAATGGVTNTFTVSSTQGMYVNMPLSFVANTGAGQALFSTVTAGYTYYIFAVLDQYTIQISTAPFGTVWQLATVASGNMTLNFPANNSYLQGPTTNMVVNYPIQFTGTALGGVAVGTTYYIQDVIDGNDFTISSSLVTVTISSTVTGTNVLTVSSASGTASLIPLNPIVFNTPVIDSITAGTKYYISSIVNSTTFTIASSIIAVSATQTQSVSNLITVTSTTGFVVNQPIKFVGTTFGNIQSETVYYISVINDGFTFTVSSVPGGQTFALSPATGLMTAKTCPAAVTFAGVNGTMVGVSTAAKSILSLGSGTMTGTFSTSLFGNVVLGTTYYVNSINPTSFTVATSSGGLVTFGLSTNNGTMNVAAAGWDHINPGTPITTVLDSSSNYFIEPRTTYSAPPFSQVRATRAVSLPGSTTYTAAAYGNGTWVALPSANATGAYSIDGTSWSTLALPSVQSWSGVAYGNGYWAIIASGGTTAAVSKSNGAGWTNTTLPATANWNGIAYGNGTFVAISSSSYNVAYSTNYGYSWSAGQSSSTVTATGFTVSGGVATITFATTSVPPFIVGNTTYGTPSTISLSGFTPLQTSGSVNTINGTFTVVSCTTSQVTFNLTGTYTVAALGTVTGYQSGMPTNGSWSSVTYGKGIFVAVQNGTNQAVYSTDGKTWTATTLPSSTAWSSVAYGNGAFVAVANTTSTSAYSNDGKNWYASNISITASLVAYAQGAFVAVNSAGSTTAYTCEDGYSWQQQTVAADYYSVLVGGYSNSNVGQFTTFASQGTIRNISAGCRTKGRAVVASGQISAINEFEAGSGYTSAPTVTFTDPNITTLAIVNPRLSNGVLGSPSFVNRGSGYNSASTQVTITGNGFADTYQTGLSIILNNLTRLPSPGDNLTIAGVSQVFKVTSAYSVFNTVAPNLEANVSVSPAVSIANSTANGTTVSIRSKYSQARLTNHDFLNIGYGDQANANYPGYPAAGYTSIPGNQTVEANYGRVFYTSTDQDGNFKVGSLFGVQQATGIVTLSASQFGLTGLSSLSLGGIAVGGSSVQITQFSTDASFTANSDAILPTQRSIKAYLASRLSQGGSNTFTGQLIAGTVVVGGARYIRSSVPNGTTGSVVRMISKTNISVIPGSGFNATVGVDGNLAAMNMFFKHAMHKSFNQS